MSTIRELARQRIIQSNEVGRRVIKEQKFPDIRTIGEADFVHHFLPMFSGDLSNVKETLLAWATIAGDLTRPVHIVDELGVVRATVPPVTSTSSYAPIKDRTGGVAYDLTLARQGSLPRGEDFLAYSLETRFSHMQNQGDQSEDEKAWISLLAKYGKVVPTVNKQVKSDDEPEYEY